MATALTAMRCVQVLLGALWCVTIACAAGCARDVSTVTDVTKDPKYWGGYKPDSVCVVQQDLFVILLGSWPGELYPPEVNAHIDTGSMKIDKLPSLAAYQREHEGAAYIAGIVAKGVRIRIVKIERFTTTTFNDLWITGEVLEGDFVGKLVRLDHISRFTEHGRTLEPNTVHISK